MDDSWPEQLERATDRVAVLDRLLLPFRVIAFGIWGLDDIVSHALSNWLVTNGANEQDRLDAIERRARAAASLDRKFDRLGLPRG